LYIYAVKRESEDSASFILSLKEICNYVNDM